MSMAVVMPSILIWLKLSILCVIPNFSLACVAMVLMVISLIGSMLSYPIVINRYESDRPFLLLFLCSAVYHRAQYWAPCCLLFTSMALSMWFSMLTLVYMLMILCCATAWIMILLR